MRQSIFRALLLAGVLLTTACVADDGTETPDVEVLDIAPVEIGTGGGSDETPVDNEKVLDHDYQVQQTSYWCGPAATRVALSVRMTPPSQQTLANELGTTTNGTDWIGQITQVLNNRLGGAHYATTEMPNDPPTAAQRERLWQDVLRTIDADHAVVANIVAPPGNQPPGYPSNQTIYHYFAVVGYRRDEREVYIADSANFGGNQRYWLTFDQLATLIPPKGYSALRVQP
ncbi:MAG TPA: C39 family peptidase [Kofleriaceae bacterium]